MGMCLTGFTQSQAYHSQTQAVEQSDGPIQGHEALPTAVQGFTPTRTTYLREESGDIPKQ